MEIKPDSQVTTSSITTVITTKSPAPAFIKFIRCFLLVLIVIGIGLLCSINFWVPKVVNVILGSHAGEIAPILPTATSTTEDVVQTTASTTESAVQITTSNIGGYKTITVVSLGVSFEVPQDWAVQDSLKDAGLLFVLDSKSLGDGVDGNSFDFAVSSSSDYFSSILSPDTANHFTQLQALSNGDVMKAPGKDVGGSSPLAGEEFTKVANLTIAGYPAIHFHIVNPTSYDWVTREMQDGYWVQVGGNRNLFLYFGSVDSAKKYTYATEASVMQQIFSSIHISPGI